MVRCRIDFLPLGNDRKHARIDVFHKPDFAAQRNLFFVRLRGGIVGQSGKYQGLPIGREIYLCSDFIVFKSVRCRAYAFGSVKIERVDMRFVARTILLPHFDRRNGVYGKRRNIFFKRNNVAFAGLFVNHYTAYDIKRRIKLETALFGIIRQCVIAE